MCIRFKTLKTLKYSAVILRLVSDNFPMLMLYITDTSLYIYISVKNFGMANIKK